MITHGIHADSIPVICCYLVINIVSCFKIIYKDIRTKLINLSQEIMNNVGGGGSAPYLRSAPYFIQMCLMNMSVFNAVSIIFSYNDMKQ